MKLVKLHQSGHEMLVNLSTVAEIQSIPSSNKSDLYMNFAIDSEQVSLRVDESLDEILHLSKRID